MTLAYHYVLPLDEIAAGETEPGGREGGRRRLLRRLLGRPGVVAISLLVMCSTFISLNGNALTGPRAYFAMARDGLFPAALCRIHPRFQTPANADPRPGDLGDPADGRRHRADPDPRPPAPSSRPARADPGRLGQAERDAALRRPLHLRDLRGEPLLPAGDRQRVRPPQAPSRLAPPVPDLGLSGHPPALRGRRAAAPGQHAARDAGRVARRAGDHRPGPARLPGRSAARQPPQV